MSLKRLRVRPAKLCLLLAPVNVACWTAAREIPRGGSNDVREYLGSSARASWPLEDVAPDPQVVWRADAGRGTVGAPAVGDRVTVVATVDRWVYALDTRSGESFWRFRGDGPFGAGPLVGNGRVYAATEGPNGRVASIRLSSGRRVWRTSVGDVASPLVLRDTVLYGATQSGIAFALGTARGRMLWRRQMGGTRSGPLVTERYVAIVTLTDSLVVLDRAAGTRVAQVALGASTVAPLALLNDSSAVLSSPSGRIVAFSIPAGRILWQIATMDPVFGSPAVAGDTVFALSGSCTLWSIPLAAPQTALRAAIDDCVTVAGPTVLRGGALVATIRGELFQFDRATHTRRWTRQLQQEIRHAPTVRNGQIFVAPVLGDVVSLR